jgi:hypothetical protein
MRLEIKLLLRHGSVDRSESAEWVVWVREFGK